MFIEVDGPRPVSPEQKSDRTWNAGLLAAKAKDLAARFWSMAEDAEDMDTSGFDGWL